MPVLDAIARAAVGAAAALGLGPTWPAVDALIQQRFPEVHAITTDELAAGFARLEARRAVLVDARSAAEFAVSHLPAARRIDPDADPVAALVDVERSRPIVVYCAVGYRSARVASRLQAAGYLDVSNLRGSIFRWAEEGRPLVRDGRAVREVHPYDAYWGRLLRPELRARGVGNNAPER